MKITKFEHSCLLVEMPDPVNRTILFDPGVMSEVALKVDELQFLDDIVITHEHADHLSQKLLGELVAKFPNVTITAPSDVVALLSDQNITASDLETDGIVFFDSPHESVEPLFPRPQQIGVHYLDVLSHPGDSHSFRETKAILALPVSGPWASTVTAINLAIRLKPQYVIPIHDWHWHEQARQQMYKNIQGALEKQGITFIPLKTGIPEVINT